MSDYLEYRRRLKLGKSPSEAGNKANSANPTKKAPTPAKQPHLPKSPRKGAGKPEKRGKIKRESKKRAKENRQYRPIRRKFLDEHPICEVEGCQAPSEEVHHRAGRSGKKLLDLTDFMAVCLPHHDTFEREDKAAREAGHKKSRLGKVDKY